MTVSLEEYLGFFSGTVHFAPAEENHGGFVFDGTTYDTNDNDQEIYLEVAVEGHSPNEFRNPVDQNKEWGKAVWDPQVITTETAKMRLCNSDAWRDTCTEWRHFKR